MLTTTIIFTVLVALWGNSAALSQHVGGRRRHLRGGR